MKLSVLFTLACISITCIAVINGCSNSPTAGGTTDTGNAKIAATIFTPNGKRAAGVPVKLSPAGYLPNIGDDSNAVRIQNIKETITDDSGYFNITSIDSGDYFIEINDGDSSAVLLQVSISSSDQSTSLFDTLRPYASVVGDVGSLADTSVKRFLLIYGLDRCIPVANDGTFSVNNLPAGTFHLRIIADSDAFIALEFDSIRVYPSQTVIIPFSKWSHSSEITLNTTKSGADVTADVYRFPVLIRLSSSNFDFSQAKEDGSDCRFFKSNNTPLPIDIEQWDSDLEKASIWVLIDTIYGNNNVQSITMLWGNPDAESLANSHEVFDTSDGFLGNYHFNGNLLDATVNGFNGIDYWTTDSPEGIIGKARGFDGSISFCFLGDLPDRPSGTISFWFRPGMTFDSSSAITQGIWGKKSTDIINFSISLKGKDFYSGSGLPGNLVSKLEDVEGGYYLASTTEPFNANVWYYAVVCWGESSNALYVNGILESSTSDNRPVSGDGNDEIGRSLYDISNIQAGEPRYFRGSLDEFRIDNTLRNEDWIKLCYMNQRENDRLTTFK